MKFTEKEMNILCREAEVKNTYICGCDGKLCGLSRNRTNKFPCDKCIRNVFKK